MWCSHKKHKENANTSHSVCSHDDTTNVKTNQISSSSCLHSKQAPIHHRRLELIVTEMFRELSHSISTQRKTNELPPRISNWATKPCFQQTTNFRKTKWENKIRRRRQLATLFGWVKWKLRASDESKSLGFNILNHHSHDCSAHVRGLNVFSLFHFLSSFVFVVLLWTPGWSWCLRGRC